MKEERTKKDKIKENKEKVNKKDKSNTKNDKEMIKKKEEKPNKFIEIIKKKWLIDSSKTIMLVIIIILAFFVITTIMQQLELTPIDLTKEKIFTVSEESKEQIKNIEKQVNIYFVGYSEDNKTLELAKQYKKANSNISVEAVTANSRPDLVEKYEIEESSQGIIVECGERYKVLTENDLYTYDMQTYESINVAEEKLTIAIRTVTADEIPKVYFLNGYGTTFSLKTGMNYLSMYLQNEINEIDTLDLLSKGKVPEDCATLVITTPEADFEEKTVEAITDYINRGGNILWLNASRTQSKNLPNVNKILKIYGIKPFEPGIILETDESKMVSGYIDVIIPEVQYAEATNKIASAQGVIFASATKINVEDEETLEEQKITKTELIRTSENTYFRTNFMIQSEKPQEGEEKGAFLVGAQLDKTVKDANEETGEKEIKSKLILYGENYFASDYQVIQSAQAPMIAYRNNKDLILNSISYLTNREEDITVRKSIGNIAYTATEKENRVIIAIITALPLLIMVTGIIVSIRRKRKK